MTFLLTIVPGLIFLAAIWVAMLRDRKNRSIWDEPFKDDLERPPGESCRKRVEDLLDEGMTYLHVIILILLAHIAFIQVVSTTWVQVGLTIIAVFMFAVAFIKLIKNRDLVARYNLGFKGERITAQHLSPLLAEKYYIFHDIPFDSFNIDHVVVGPKGVFAIETKTRRKRHSAGMNRAKVEYNGKELLYPDIPPETYGLDAAVSRAKELQKWLSSATGETVIVNPILSLPGWYVHTIAPHTLPVLNPKSIPNYIQKHGKANLPEDQIRRIQHQLREKSKMTLNCSKSG